MDERIQNLAGMCFPLIFGFVFGGGNRGMQLRWNRRARSWEWVQLSDGNTGRSVWKPQPQMRFQCFHFPDTSLWELLWSAWEPSDTTPYLGYTTNVLWLQVTPHLYVTHTTHKLCHIAHHGTTPIILMGKSMLDIKYTIFLILLQKHREEKQMSPLFTKKIQDEKYRFFSLKWK